MISGTDERVATRAERAQDPARDIPAPRPPAGRVRPTGIPDGPGLPRLRLLSRLDGVLGVRLATVVGPPGAGKTTLMAQWARQAPVDVTWCTMRPEHTTVARMVELLGDAVHAIGTGGPRPRDLDGLLDRLHRSESPLVVVVDDVHLACSSSAAELIQTLLLQSPPHVHLLVGSRRVPPINLAHSELSHLTVTDQDLRFTGSETSALFRDHYAAGLSPRDLARLSRHTEGWVAALKLFHLATAGLTAAEKHGAVIALAERAQYAQGYLRQQVLDPLPEPLVELLRDTSFLETLTDRRCDVVRRAGGNQTALLELERSTGLVTSQDGGITFRVHPVLRSHLATGLRDRLGAAGAEAAHRTAAELLLADGAPGEAARTFARVRDWAGVGRVLAEAGRELLDDRDLDWLESVPATEVAAQPWLQLALAVRAARNGDLAATVAYTEGAAALATGRPAALAATLSRIARSWSSGDVQSSDHWFDRLRAVLRCPASAAGTDPTGSAYHLLLRGVAEAVTGDLTAARRTLAECADAFQDDPAAAMVHQLLLVLLFDTSPGAADAVSHQADRLGLAWFARMADGVADTRRRVATPSQTGSRMPRVLDAESRDDQWGAALLVAVQGALLLHAGRPDAALLADLARRLRLLDAPALEAWALAGAALAAAASDLPDAGRDAESAAGFARSAGVPGALAVAYAAMARCRPDRAGELERLAEHQAEQIGLGLRPWEWCRERPASARSATSTTTAVPRPRLAMEVRCFAGFAIRVDGELPHLTRARPRAREALRLLALHAGRPVHREVLIDALWQGLDPTAATHNLHVSVSTLRAILEPGAHRGDRRLLTRDGDRYTLAMPPSSYSDLQAFEEACARAERRRAAGDADGSVEALEEAVALYAGEVLPEDGPAEWVIGPRDRFRVRAADAAAALAEARMRRRQHREAAAAALRSIDIDPCRDGSWRLLLAAYEAVGDLAAAERARRSYAEVLASLGVVADSVSAVLPRHPPRGR
jgi:DNA-binding SARP family transcriptional activator